MTKEQKKFSLPPDRIKILLLEGVHPGAHQLFKASGYSSIESSKKALNEKDLEESIKDAHFIGIRSRTQLNSQLLEKAEKLIAIGCFCIGTNQVDLDAARAKGIPVFNAPHSNTRSVAELVISEMIALKRGLFDKSSEMHQGVWNKSAKGSNEIRGKTLGIIGYGHIGSQVSILAEALGMKVIFHDVESKLTMGNALQFPSLNELLKQSDVITLHVPETPETEKMINAKVLKATKKGAILINASRGKVVEIPALAEAIKSKHLAGAAIDVFPKEPKGLDEEFLSPLRGLPGVILSPHIGGSTMEAQKNIGIEVATKLLQYSNQGSTTGAVNFPNLSLPAQLGGHRLLHIHKNQPGVLSEVNRLLAESKTNILGQYLRTDEEVGYVVIDIDKAKGPTLRKKLLNIPGTLRCRIIY